MSIDKNKEAIDLAYKLESADLPATVVESINISTAEGRDVFVMALKRIQAVSELVSDDIKARQLAKKRLERTEEWLIQFAKENIFSEGSTEIQGVEYLLQKRNVKAKLILENPELIPSEYKKEVVSIEIDKARITEDLALGVPVAGAKLEQGSALHILVNTRKLAS